MTALPLDRLEAACLAVRNINLDSAEVHTVGEIVCPLCGDGSVNVETWTNIDEKPVGIEVFGVGNALTDYETFLREANPATILDLIQALRLSEAGREADMRAAYLAGFKVSGEGWNGEVPFEGVDPEQHGRWVSIRDRTLAALKDNPHD